MTTATLAAHILAQKSRPGADAFVKIVQDDEGRVVGFKPMLSYKREDGFRGMEILAETCDLPDFSEDGSRQCFVDGYERMEDAIAVVNAFNANEPEIEVAPVRHRGEDFHADER